MQLNIAFTPSSLEIIVLILLCVAILLLQVYRRFPVHLIYRSKIGFESMLDAVDEPLAVISESYSIRRVNKAYLNLTGRSYRVCINAKCYYLLRGRISPCEDCRLRETIRLGEAQQIESAPHPHGKGSINISFTLYAMPVRGNTAELCAIEHIRDITTLENLKIGLERRNAFLATLTRKLRAARRNVKADLRVASRIQLGLMPSEIPQLDNMRIGMVYRPVDDVGGDVYDFIRMDGNRFGIFVGDASGHGLAASLIGTLSKMSLYNHSRANLSTAELLEQMNRDLTAHIHSEHYLTCVWYVFDFDKKILRYSRAGHPLQLVQRKNGDLESMHGDGLFLGFNEESKYEEKELAFGSGDRFFLFTDGAFDIFSKSEPGKLLGFNGFKEMVKATAGKPHGEIIPALKEGLAAYRHNDDCTMIVAEIL